MSGWTVRTIPKGAERFTIVAVSGCRVIRLAKQSPGDVLAFDPELAWSGGTPPRINAAITDLAATA